MKTVRSLTLMIMLIWSTGGRAADRMNAQEFVRGKIAEFAELIQGTNTDRFEVLRARVRSVVDFDGFAKRALGNQWTAASAADRQRFGDAMQKLLESHYLSRPATVFDKNKVAVVSATVEGDVTIVRATVKRQDVDIEVLIKLSPERDNWRVTDVTIDGLSLLEDYRAQFQSFLKKKNLAQLVTRLHEKADANMRNADGSQATKLK